MHYFAKSMFPDGRHITVKEHLEKVAEWSGRYGQDIGFEAQAYNAGLFHDFGKYSDLFQQLIRGEHVRVDHAMASGAFLSGIQGFDWQRICEAVAGHHEGLVSFGQLEPYFKASVAGRDGYVPSPMPKGRPVGLAGRDEFVSAQSVMQHDFGGKFPVRSFDRCFPRYDSDEGKMSRMMSTRMVLSCLCDADFTVSAWEECLDDSLFNDGKLAHVEKYLEKLIGIHDALCINSRADEHVNAMRSVVWDDCGKTGRMPGSRFCTLTAPTGAGKTMGMLRFALERASVDPGIEHVIFALPFLSLTDQVSKDVEAVFGADGFLRHDSVSDFIYSDGSDAAKATSIERALHIMSRWSAPVVVTTTVQFFQSLFSYRPGDVRKLHRLGKSIIIFDEIQALPVQLMRMCVMALRQLSDDYGAHVLLSSATQPSFGHIQGLRFQACEVIEDVPALFGMVPRTGISMCKHGPQPVSQIVSDAARYDNVCVITNLKRHAREAHQAFVDLGVEHPYLVSTDLCPDHRKAVINEISRLQAAGESVHVAATQCLEAGVDLDFEKLYRALAPFTSLVQSAGRQNRNGLYQQGNITVFEVDDKGRLYPDDKYKRQALAVRDMCAAGSALSRLYGVDEYYYRVFRDYGTDYEQPELRDALHSIDFKGFSEQSRLIRSGGFRIVVPYHTGYDDDRYEMFKKTVLDGSFQLGMLKDVAGICVQVFSDRIDSLGAFLEEAVVRDFRHDRDIRTGTYVLLDEGLYDPSFGLDSAKDIPGGALFL